MGMVSFAWRRQVTPLAAFVFVFIAAAFVWKTVEAGTKPASAHALHMEHSVKGRPDTARHHHAHLNGNGSSDCTGTDAICPMMGLCHPALLVDLSLLTLVVHHDDAVAIAVGRGTGIKPTIVLPPPRQLHL